MDAAPHDPTCIHCGFCLPACPTYAVLGTEMDSPRGRLHLMQALEQGRIQATPGVVRHLDTCLGCLACESACPSGVRYGHQLQATRSTLTNLPGRAHGRARLGRWIQRAVAWPPWVQSGLDLGRRALVASGLARRVAGWHPALALLAATSAGHAAPPAVTPPSIAMRSRVALLSGCVGRLLFGQVNVAAARVCSAAGDEVVVPAGQRCCGALALHEGDLEAARRLARHNIEAFDRAGPFDAVLVTAAGCGSTMKEYGELLASDPDWADRARLFSDRVRDVLEWLGERGAPEWVSPVSARVTYHDACHLAHAQGVRTAPRELLASIPGLELVPLPDSERCCGSAGIYNVLQPDVARQLGEAKLDAVARTQADVVAAANPGCLLQLAAGLGARGQSTRTCHPIELMAEALEQS